MENTNLNTESNENEKTDSISSEEDRNHQSRRYCLTINNPTETDEEVMEYLKSLEHIKYFIFSREKGNLEGTEHFQMFIIFTIGKRFSTVKKLFPKAHIEEARGSSIQCRDYCSKSDTHISGPFEFGELSEQSSKKDLQTFFDLVNNGASDYEIETLFPKLYEKNVTKIPSFRNAKILNDFSNKIRDDIIVTYIYGSTGVGKTYGITKKYKDGSYYRVTDYYKDPWQNYTDQKVVVLDEFRSQFGIVSMLHFMDIYPVSLPARFTNKVTCYNKLFIISNIPPSAQYMDYRKNESETYKAFNRRIHHVVYLTKDKCLVEKTRDIEELKSILPDDFLQKLEISPMATISQNKNTSQEELIRFEEIPTDDLPF